MSRFRLLRIFLSPVAVLTLSACAGSHLMEAQQAVPQGPEFSQALYREYVDLSEYNYYGGEGYSSYVFSGKAQDAAAGEDVQPTAPGGMMGALVSGESKAGLEAGYNRLLSSFARGARTSIPRHAARAQAAYDCWLYGTRGGDDRRAAQCSQRFDATMTEIEAALGQPLPAGVPVLTSPSMPAANSRTPSLTIETDKALPAAQ